MTLYYTQLLELIIQINEMTTLNHMYLKQSLAEPSV